MSPHSMFPSTSTNVYVLFMIYTKEEKCFESIFQKISAYTKVSVTEEDLYLNRKKTLWCLTYFIGNNTFKM